MDKTTIMQTFKYIQESVELFSTGILANDERVPCSSKEVQELEVRCGGCLPEAYKEFLLWGGKKLGHFMCGESFFYPYANNTRVKKIATNILEKHGFNDIVSTDIFIYQMHNSYEFDFFYLKESADPKVYFHSESYPEKISLVKEHFSERLLEEIKRYITRKESYFLQYKSDLRDLKINPVYIKTFSINGSVYFSELPEELYLFTNLKRLDLRHSKIEYLTKQMNAFQHLVSINLNGNKLETLPKELLELPLLHEIRLSGNNIPKILQEEYKNSYPKISFYF